jgi:hypothetical protein
MEPSSSDHWTLGDVFLRSIFASFDYGQGRIGLAYSKKPLPLSDAIVEDNAMSGEEEEEEEEIVDVEEKVDDDDDDDDTPCEDTAACQFKKKATRPSSQVHVGAGSNSMNTPSSIAVSPSSSSRTYPEVFIGLMAYVLIGSILLTWKWICCCCTSTSNQNKDSSGEFEAVKDGEEEPNVSVWACCF